MPAQRQQTLTLFLLVVGKISINTPPDWPVSRTWRAVSKIKNLYHCQIFFALVSFNNLITLDIIETMEAFLERKRPPVHIRNKVDLGYKMEGQSIYIFEIRPRWTNPEIRDEHPFAKATYVIAKNEWKIYWIRSNGNWDPYSPQRTVKDIGLFVKLVEEDAYHCFWG